MTTVLLRTSVLPAAAIRLGRALEGWGRRASRPIDREQLLLRRRLERETAIAMASREAAQSRARGHLLG